MQLTSVVVNRLVRCHRVFFNVRRVERLVCVYPACISVVECEGLSCLALLHDGGSGAINATQAMGYAEYDVFRRIGAFGVNEVRNIGVTANCAVGGMG